MLNTWEFGLIRIVEKVDARFDTFIRSDIIGEWEYWQFPSGEIVAVWVGED